MLETLHNAPGALAHNNSHYYYSDYILMLAYTERQLATERQNVDLCRLIVVDYLQYV